MLIKYNVKTIKLNIMLQNHLFGLFLNKKKYMQLIISERVTIIFICGKNIIIKYYEASSVTHDSSK